MTSKTQIFIKLIRYLDASCIDYAVLGNTLTYPSKIPSDVDVVIGKNHFKLVSKIMGDFCQVNNLLLCNCLHHEITAKYFVVASQCENGTVNFLAIDFCSDYYRQARLIMPSKMLLNNNKYHTFGDVSFKVCDDGVAFIYYFIKKVEKGSFDAEQLDYLQTLYNKSTVGVVDHLFNFFPDNYAYEIKAVFENRRYCEINPDFISKLKDYFKQVYHISPHSILIDFTRRIKRIFKPTGVAIAFLGCDGSGKSTIIKHLLNEKSLDGPFRKKIYFHLFPSLGPEKNEVVNNPHTHKARSVIMSNLKLLYLFVKYILGYWTIVYPKKIQSTMVIFDRYYHDILVDPLRYRHAGSNYLTVLISKLVPQPDIFFFIDASEKIILSRKQEVPAMEVTRQRYAYLKLAETLKSSYVIKNEGSPEESAYITERHITEYMSIICNNII